MPESKLPVDKKDNSNGTTFKRSESMTAGTSMTFGPPLTTTWQSSFLIEKNQTLLRESTILTHGMALRVTSLEKYLSSLAGVCLEKRAKLSTVSSTSSIEATM